EVVGFGVVVGRGGDHHPLGAGVGLAGVGGGVQVEVILGEHRGEFGVDDRAAPVIDLGDLVGVDVQRDHLVVLREHDGIGQADISGPDDDDLHGYILLAVDAGTAIMAAPSSTTIIGKAAQVVGECLGELPRSGGTGFLEFGIQRVTVL